MRLFGLCNYTHCLHSFRILYNFLVVSIVYFIETRNLGILIEFRTELKIQKYFK